MKVMVNNCAMTLVTQRTFRPANVHHTKDMGDYGKKAGKVYLMTGISLMRVMSVG